MPPGTLTPPSRPRSCLKHSKPNSPRPTHPDYDDIREGGSGTGRKTNHHLLAANAIHSPAPKFAKSVSFDASHEPQHVYIADPDYDRQSVPVAQKLSYECVFVVALTRFQRC